MKILLLICALLLGEIYTKDISEEFPDITDLFANPASEGLDGRRSFFDKKDLIVDLNTLDEKSFQKNVEMLKKELQMLDLNNTFGKSSNETAFGPRPSRRAYLTYLAVKNSPSYIPWTKTPGDEHGYGWKVKKGIITHMWSTKISDLMIQFIYMARHKIMELDSQTIKKPKPENYRQIFLYKHLVRISDKLWDLHQMIRNQSRIVHNRHIHYLRVWLMMTNSIKMHQRAVKLYGDFLYFWWVFVRIQERFMERTHVIITRPPSTEFTVLTKVSLPLKDLIPTDTPPQFNQYGTRKPFTWPSWITFWKNTKGNDGYVH